MGWVQVVVTAQRLSPEIGARINFVAFAAFHEAYSEQKGPRRIFFSYAFNQLLKWLKDFHMQLPLLMGPLMRSRWKLFLRAVKLPLKFCFHLALCLNKWRDWPWPSFSSYAFNHMLMWLKHFRMQLQLTNVLTREREREIWRLFSKAWKLSLKLGFKINALNQMIEGLSRADVAVYIPLGKWGSIFQELVCYLKNALFKSGVHFLVQSIKCLNDWRIFAYNCRTCRTERKLFPRACKLPLKFSLKVTYIFWMHSKHFRLKLSQLMYPFEREQAIPESLQVTLKVWLKPLLETRTRTVNTIENYQSCS